MTREEIEKDYRTTEGIITSPGKFEACPVYAPYFWDLYLNGAWDEYDCDENITWFTIDTDDTSSFPELSEYVRVGIWEDGNGFVYCCHEEKSGELP